MPIGWGVDHTARLVLARAKDVVSRTDIEKYIDDLVTAATLSYRKVLDLGECRLELNHDDIVAIGERIRSHESWRAVGRVAVIATSDALYEQACLFETLAAAKRPLKVFRDAQAAYDWLTVGRSDGIERRRCGISR